MERTGGAQNLGSGKYSSMSRSMLNLSIPWLNSLLHDSKAVNLETIVMGDTA